MKRLLLVLLPISMNFIFGQSGSSGGLGKYFKNSSVMIGMNQSFYGEEWNDIIDSSSMGQNPFRKLNFTLLNEFDHGVLGGVKYLSYGYDIESSVTEYYYFSSQYQSIKYETSIDLKFLKLFLTYPLSSGFYLGLEGGYFMEGKYKQKYTGEDLYKEDIDRDMWKDEFGLSEFDYGLLGQFYYNINKDILVSVEGYYGLSKFDEDIDQSNTGTPNVFHYVNLGVVYKFSNKIIK